MKKFIILLSLLILLPLVATSKTIDSNNEDTFYGCYRYCTGCQEIARKAEAFSPTNGNCTVYCDFTRH